MSKGGFLGSGMSFNDYVKANNPHAQGNTVGTSNNNTSSSGQYVTTRAGKQWIPDNSDKGKLVNSSTRKLDDQIRQISSNMDKANKIINLGTQQFHYPGVSSRNTRTEPTWEQPVWGKPTSGIKPYGNNEKAWYDSNLKGDKQTQSPLKTVETAGNPASSNYHLANPADRVYSYSPMQEVYRGINPNELAQLSKFAQTSGQANDGPSSYVYKEGELEKAMDEHYGGERWIFGDGFQEHLDRGSQGARDLYPTWDRNIRSNFPVLATTPGTVEYAGYLNDRYGNTVVWRDDNGGLHWQAHMAHQPLVGVGDRLELRQMLGNVGGTGRSFGDHIHYEYIPEGGVFDNGVFRGTRSGDVDHFLSVYPR